MDRVKIDELIQDLDYVIVEFLEARSNLWAVKNDLYALDIEHKLEPWNRSAYRSAMERFGNMSSKLSSATERLKEDCWELKKAWYAQEEDE